MAEWTREGRIAPRERCSWHYGWFVGWMVIWLVGWLIGWLDGWLAGTSATYRLPLKCKLPKMKLIINTEESNFCIYFFLK